MTKAPVIVPSCPFLFATEATQRPRPTPALLADHSVVQSDALVADHHSAMTRLLIEGARALLHIGTVRRAVEALVLNRPVVLNVVASKAVSRKSRLCLSFPAEETQLVATSRPAHWTADHPKKIRTGAAPTHLAAA